MEIFRAIAGYSYGKADVVRRAISKKKADVIASERSNFVEGAVALGASYEDAEGLFEDMTGFANYGFKKAHAAAYAFVSFRTAYLKAHYPAYYMSALLTSVLGDMTKTALYVADAKKMGIKLLAPDINVSGMSFTATEDGNIRYGMLALKNVGEPFVRKIIEERKNRPFRSFADFVERMADKDINKRQVDSLIKCGAFDSFGIYRSVLLQVYENLIDLAHEKHRNDLSGQLGFFGGSDENIDIEYPDIADFTMAQKLMIEREVSGLCFSGHPVDEYKEITANLPHSEIISVVSSEITDERNEKLCGVVTNIITKNTRNGKTVAFVTLEDDTAQIELVVFNDIFEGQRELFILDKPLYVEGRITQKEDEYPKLVVSRASLLTNETAKSAPERRVTEFKRERTLYLRVPSVGSSEYRRALALVEIFDGGTPVVFYDMSDKKYLKISGRGVAASEFVLAELGEILGSPNVVCKG